MATGMVRRKRWSSENLGTEASAALPENSGVLMPQQRCLKLMARYKVFVSPLVHGPQGKGVSSVKAVPFGQHSWYQGNECLGSGRATWESTIATTTPVTDQLNSPAWAQDTATVHVSTRLKTLRSIRSSLRRKS